MKIQDENGRVIEVPKSYQAKIRKAIQRGDDVTPLIRQFGGITEEGATPAQTERGEMIVLPNNEIVPVLADKLHKQQKDVNKITDVLPEGAFVLSDAKQRRIKGKELKDLKEMLFSPGVTLYGEGKKFLLDDVTFGDVLPKTNKPVSYADIGKGIAKKYQTVNDPYNIFSVATDIDNLEARAPFLQKLIDMQEEHNRVTGKGDTMKMKYGGIPKYELGGNCPPGWYRDPSTGECKRGGSEMDGPFGPNTVYASGENGIPGGGLGSPSAPSSPSGMSNILPCPPGMRRDFITKKCMPMNVGGQMSCPPGQLPDPVTGMCKDIASSFSLNTDECPEGWVKDATGTCRPDMTAGGIGYAQPGQAQGAGFPNPDDPMFQYTNPDDLASKFFGNLDALQQENIGARDTGLSQYGELMKKMQRYNALATVGQTAATVMQNPNIRPNRVVPYYADEVLRESLPSESYMQYMANRAMVPAGTMMRQLASEGVSATKLPSYIAPQIAQAFDLTSKAYADNIGRRAGAFKDYYTTKSGALQATDKNVVDAYNETERNKNYQGRLMGDILQRYLTNKAKGEATGTELKRKTNADYLTNLMSIEQSKVPIISKQYEGTLAQQQWIQSMTFACQSHKGPGWFYDPQTRKCVQA